MKQVAGKLDDLMKTVQQYQEHEEERIQHLKHKFISETYAGGRYALLDGGDVEDALRDIAPYRKQGKTCFHDPEALESLLTHMKNEKKKLLDFTGKIEYATKLIQQRDYQAAQSFKEAMR